MRAIFKVLLTLIIVFNVQMSTSYGYDWACIDPGHGGPGANKYGCNGWGHNTYQGSPAGASGPLKQLTEQWVNLQVGLKLDYIIDVFGAPYDGAIMTRYDSTTDLTLEDRANYANKANGGTGTRTFLSIHHNGLPLNHQGTETWWCTAVDTTDSGWNRDTTSLLAQKVRWRIRDMWHYCSRCERDPDNCDPIVNMNCEDCWGKRVLRLTKMASVLSEASNLNCAHEESLFDDESYMHTDSEAIAIYHGWHSFLNGYGVVTLTYAYEGGYYGGYEGKMIIDMKDTVTTPFLTCWEFPEDHRLDCKGIMSVGEYTYTFNHWNHDWIIPHNPYECWWDVSYDTALYLGVPPEHNHNYYAYMSGGPYSTTVISPNGYEIWHIGEQRYIHWNATPGADSSSKVDIYISRDGGASWIAIGLNLDYDWNSGGYLLWTVSEPPSTQCRIKVTASDCAQNTSYDISDQTFIIGTSGNNNPEIDSPIHCKYPQEECNQCFHFGDSRTLEINAHDPDGDSMYYEWWCGPSPWGGHFSNGQNHIFTPQNYVVYTAPPPGKYESDTLFKDHLSVGVSDIRGGQTPNYAEGDVEITTPGYSCLCGDTNGSGVLELGDIVTLINYLYKGGVPPMDPMIRGDANNTCELDAGDIIFLINYLYYYGDYPVCCWIH
jgi:N-acetylmuramoyl-L-alanine amidase